jgi:exo-1,4-beta-D-glucosaminidase
MLTRILAVLFLVVSAFSQDGPLPERSSRRELSSNWRIQSGCKVEDGGASISRAGYDVRTWLATTVPHTVLGAQVDAKLFGDPFYGMNLRAIPGTTYPIGALFGELPMPANSPYRCPFWYRSEFELPASDSGRRLALHFEGINYRANIWVNGKQIANSDEVAGAYRTYEFDATDVLRPGKMNTVAAEVFAGTEKDLGIGFVDWNPGPADRSMGIFRPVYITASGPVAVRYPSVSTHFPDASLTTAELTVVAELQNLSTEPVSGVAEAALDGIASVSQNVTLAPGERRTAIFTPEQFSRLRVAHPRLWWPYPLGPQNLENGTVTFRTAAGTSDRASTQFGIREITSELTDEKHLLVKVNGRNLLIRGGGWSPDIFLRVNEARTRDDLAYVRDLGLNTVRLEGKIETDDFFELTDRMGILVMAGWCCCDHWEHWDKWSAADHEIAKESQRSQIARLRSHPSMLMWLNGSDGPPPADVERDYLAVLKDLHWPNPVVSSASSTPTSVTGESGVKMTGPYDYVPPSYWLADPGHWGGAYGFNTETSPGPAPPVLSSQRKFIPKQNLWPHDDVWNFHAGSGAFAQTNIFDNAMAVMYGLPTSAEDYDMKSQLMTYEGERSMYEAYALEKYHTTGIVQWMLNNAWPSVIWHLYDYYLAPGGGYFGTKKANEMLHAQYSYVDRSVAVVNSWQEPKKNLRLQVRAFDVDSKPLFSNTVPVDVPSDGVGRVLTLPELSPVKGVFFVRLDLSDGSGKPLSHNFYWVPTRLPEFDWEKSSFFSTPPKPRPEEGSAVPFTYSDMTPLFALAPAQVSWKEELESKRDESTLRVTLHNGGRNIALFVRVRVTKAPGEDDIAPVFFDDNYVSLLPDESRTITARFRAKDGGRTPTVIVEGVNLRSAERAR